MDGIALTARQRSMLCWLAATDGVLPRKEGIEQSNSQLSSELVETLGNIGLLEKPVWTEGRWVHKPNEQGLAIVLTVRHSKTGCQACVSTHCVCRLKLVCVAGCGNAGCHGSHD